MSSDVLGRLFPGNSEMARRMRAFDWTTTPLGPPGQWPQSLRAAVSICLGSRYPIVIWWGKETYTQLYNDAYISFLGSTKHPWLGRSGRECWKEIWDTISPMLESVFATGEATWSEDFLLVVDRNVRHEEGYFTFSYSPLWTDSAEVGGIFCACSEVTGRVIGERRLATLRDFGVQSLQTHSVTEACRKAASVLADNPCDVAFAAIYQRANESGRTMLYASAGFDENAVYADVFLPSIESAINLKRPQQLDLTALDVKFPGGTWPEPAEKAVVLPLLSPTKETVAGVAVLGVSPRRPFDADYRSFFDLVAGQIATAMANARAYEEERQRSEALAALDRAKTTFFSNISHEFRTPLTLLLGPLEEALRDARAEHDPVWRDRLELMHRNTLRLQKLVNTLLDFSRIEARRTEANYEPIDLPSLTAQLAGMFDSAMKQAGLRLVIDCPPASVPAYVDRDMWEKIVMNLLSNAFKFTFEGEIAVSVRLTGEGFEFSVRDTGVGIPPDEIALVFERFHRVRHARSRTHEGTGIGLALVHELVRLHGGQIHATSTVGHGTTFTIAIPAGSAHLPPDRIIASRVLASTAPGINAYVEEVLRWLPTSALGVTSQGVDDYPTAAVTAMPCPGARVLIADDSADMRYYLRSLLGRYWSVETVADGNAALEQVREKRPELVVSDVMMPGLDGFELLRSLRGDERTKDLPVILLSARAGEEAAVQALAAGADAYLVKPFAASELIAYVGGHLQLHRLRQQSLVALRASEEKFSAAFDQSPLVLTITSLDDGRIIEVNDSFVRLTGYSQEETLGHTIDELNLWVEPEQRSEGLTRLRAGERVTIPGVRFRTKSGKELTCLIGSRVIEIDGQPHVLSSVADVTDLVRAEAVIAADLAAMTRLNEIGTSCAHGQILAAEFLDLILAAAMEFTHADKGNIQLYDAKLDALTIAVQRGFDEPFLNFFARVRDEDAAACGATLRSNDRIIVEDVMQSEIFSDSEARDVLLAAGVRAVQSTPLLSSAGNVLGMISTHHAQPFQPDNRQLRLLDLLAREAADFLQRIRAEEALREHADELAALNSALKDADRRKDEFLAMLGHELRNPLAAVRNAVAIASLDEAHRGRALEIARRQTEQLGRLIDDLLDVARVTQGRISLRKQWISLAEIIRRAIDSTQSFIAGRGVVLDTSVSEDPMLVDADPVRLEQVFVNLLTNAGKYTDAGGRISVDTEQRANTVAVRVRDTGIGICGDLLPRIWDLFAQSNQSLDRSHGGLGIGLTIVRRLVELHGGRVEAHSEGPGMGSEFVVILPLLPMQSTETVQPAAENFAKRGVRVLLVEDNPDAAESLTMLLELLGHRVRSAPDGVAALDAARANPPDVMLVDIGLPGIDGYEVARRVRQEPSIKDTVLVALTGYGRDEDKQNAMAAGFDYHLVKPIHPDALNGLVSGLGNSAIVGKPRIVH
jgi:PAS domain S-box-containing protein